MKVLFFKAPWCTACHAIEDTVPSYVLHIDCDEDQETPLKYNVSSLPLFLMIDDDGEEIARIQTTNVKAIDRWVDAIKKSKEAVNV